jgi:hypothetical protein
MEHSNSGTSTRRFLRIRVVVLIAVVVGALAGAGAWLSHPSVLDGGAEMTAPVAVGQTAYSDAGIYPSLAAGHSIDINITDLKPRVLIDTSDAEIDLLVCTPASQDVRIGAVTGPISKYCATSSSWQPGPFTVDDGLKPYLVLAITPTHDGVIAVDGVDITYRRGIRYGTQHTGSTVIVVASSTP